MAACLRELGFSLREEAYIKGLFFDVLLTDHQVVIEFDGPHHFLQTHSSEQLPQLRRARDIFHEKVIGLPVVRVSYLDWDALGSKEEKQHFLQEKISDFVGLENNNARLTRYADS